jgi:acyl carrier protein
MNDLKKTVIDIIKNAAPGNLRDTVGFESNLIEDLGFNSLKLLSLSIELEKKANFDVLRASEEADLAAIRTVNDVMDMLLMYQK